MKSNNNSTPYLSSEDILKNDFFDDEEQYVEPTTEQIAAAKKLCPDIPPGCLVEILGRQYKNNILNHSQLIEFTDISSICLASFCSIVDTLT